MWYRTAIRKKLAEKIIRKLPNSLREENDVRKSIHEYVYGLELGEVRPGDQEVIRKGVMAVYDKKSSK